MTSNVTSVNLLQRWAGASTQVVTAIKNASAKTGVSFDYLMNKAKQESSFKADAKASTSSATGLFQFIDSTWLQAMKDHGSKFGLGNIADQISDSGKVADPATKQKILDLRKDPAIAANITAAMTQDNASYLQNSLGGKVGENELYLAHFMGLGGADKFLKARQDNPTQAAADLFPSAASANKNVFYDVSGRKKSVEEVYDFFAAKMGSTSNGQPVTLLANADPSGLTKNTSVSREGLVSIKPVGRGFSLPLDELGRSDVAQSANWAQRQLLESMLAGINNFGNFGDKENKSTTGNLLSPYTSFVLAKLQSPDDKTDKG